MNTFSGYEKINQELMTELKSIDYVDRAQSLGLKISESNKVEVNFLGTDYLIGIDGINTRDGNAAEINLGSVLAGYIIRNGRGTPAGKFVPLSELTGMARPGKNNYVKNTLESRLADHVQKNPVHFEEMMKVLKAEPCDQVGSGGKSWIIKLLPKIPVQIIFYEGDEDFPPEMSLLLDRTATCFLEFEFLAVLLTRFVEQVMYTLKSEL